MDSFVRFWVRAGELLKIVFFFKNISENLFPESVSEGFSFSLRVLGSPNPGQSFGRGLSGPQATEVRMDPVGSWAATNLTVHSSNSFLGPSFWVRALGSYS